MMMQQLHRAMALLEELVQLAREIRDELKGRREPHPRELERMAHAGEAVGIDRVMRGRDGSSAV